MKWKYKVYKSGDVRVVRKLLLLPKFLDGTAKWLTIARVCQTYIDNKWKDVHFVD